MLDAQLHLLAGATFLAPLIGFAAVVVQRMGSNRELQRWSNPAYFGALFGIAAVAVPLLFFDYSSALVLGLTLVGMTVSATMESGRDRRPVTF